MRSQDIGTWRLGPMRCADCPKCGKRFAVVARGNALGDAARVRALTMTHYKLEHTVAPGLPRLPQ